MTRARLRGRWVAAWLVGIGLALLLNAWPWGYIVQAPWRAAVALAVAGGLKAPVWVAEAFVIGTGMGSIAGFALITLHRQAVAREQPFGVSWVVLHTLAWALLVGLAVGALAAQAPHLPTWPQAVGGGLVWAALLAITHPLTWRCRGRERWRWLGAYIAGGTLFFLLTIAPPVTIVRLSPAGWPEKVRFLLLAPLLWGGLTAWALPDPTAPPGAARP